MSGYLHCDNGDGGLVRTGIKHVQRLVPQLTVSVVPPSLVATPLHGTLLGGACKVQLLMVYAHTRILNCCNSCQSENAQYSNDTCSGVMSRWYLRRRTFPRGIVIDCHRVVDYLFCAVSDFVKPSGVFFFVDSTEIVALPAVTVPHSDAKLLFQFLVCSGDGGAL